ncbi:EGF domain-specific O-linked N-acetylglucosamine transferase-like isoform X1 [Selaginella moellendorffii]|uniref:EGF domain-specific O-linked N-acetylglucosamine transferase-like isoform X1 n=1 Tax=Selaginella moellendorffii TaxID=88036 RepID=UPI000D1CA7CD|nr:EGF domain-specific O-linked N-acetylglucosamine transferase-like isoform X1 [Selaginella moellendorffii]|eukprot:XP_024543058.1 EGF domain-specific O-linked N-acetylglucosamine transferase-like isoform X1 [Selaginella moellendorffii]
MAKACKLEVNLHWIHHWLNLWKNKIIPKKMTKIHNIVATCVLLGSCSASFVVLATVILANSDCIVPLQGLASRESVSCDFSHPSTSICSLQGDVRVKGSNLTVALTSANQSAHSNVLAKIRPYTRKWEKMMKTIGEVNMVSLPKSKQMACDVRHSVPAVIFSTGGYTGSIFHDFNDGLVPLFITAQRFKGEVVFMVLQFKHWWPGKYAPILKHLTHYPVVDFDREQLVHCFPEVIVGLRIHGDLLIEEGLAGTSMRSFQNLLDIALNPGQVVLPKTKPMLVLVNRETSRVIVNRNETIALAEKLGYEVHTFAPNFNTRLSEIYSLLHSADVLIGVHGAALTHFLFMRPGSTLIQIIPFGLNGPAETCFGRPAEKAGLNYVGYQILPSESTLSDEFGLNHTVIVNPDEVTAKGWTERKRIYLDGQNIRLHLPRLEQILKDVLTRHQ